MQMRTILYQYIKTLIKHVFLLNFTHALLMILEILINLRSCLTNMLEFFVKLVRSLSGKNWQDRYKADKASISFPVTPKDKLKCFWGCNEDIRKIYHPGG